MANESKVSSLASTLIPRIIEDAMFIAEQTVIMPALVTNYTAPGMGVRYVGLYPQATASTVAEGAAASAYTEITKTEGLALTPTIIQVEAVLTDERVATDPDDAMMDAAQVLGLALGRKIDTDLVNQFGSFTTKKGNAGSAVTIANVAAAISVLQKNSTPFPLNAVMHPYHWYDVWTELGQPTTNRAFLGDVANQALRDYFAGDFLGAQWYTDSNIDKIGGTAGTAHSGVFNMAALALDTRSPIEFESDRLVTQRSTVIAGHARYASGVRRQVHGAAVIGDVTEPS